MDQPIANQPTGVPGRATADELAAAFSAVWSSGRSNHGEAPLDIGVRLAELCQRARQQRPTLSFEDKDLVVAIATVAVGDASRDKTLHGEVSRDEASRSERAKLDSYLQRCRSGDLLLAMLAARGVTAAIAEVEQEHRATIDSTCRRFAGASHTAEDLKQILRARLFVAEAGRVPKIADYAGQGFLENWLRVTAVRIFLDLAKRKDRAREALVGDDEVLALPQPGDLALDVVKSEYREAVAAAMHEAAKRLAPGDRHLLRQHLVAGLSIDQLGAVLGIHRATAARRIARAREQLVADTRKELVQRLQIDPHELDEVIGLVMSRLDVSIGKLLATRPSVSTPSSVP